MNKEKINIFDDIENIINAWEEKEFGHYQCDCVPANKKQVNNLAKDIVSYHNKEIKDIVKELFRIDLKIADGVYDLKDVQEHMRKIVEEL